MSKIHPYLPNSVPEIKEKMMEKIGIESIDELFSDIPQEFIYKQLGAIASQSQSSHEASD